MNVYMHHALICFSKFLYFSLPFCRVFWYFVRTRIIRTQISYEVLILRWSFESCCSLTMLWSSTLWYSYVRVWYIHTRYVSCHPLTLHEGSWHIYTYSLHNVVHMIHVIHDTSCWPLVWDPSSKQGGYSDDVLLLQQLLCGGGVLVYQQDTSDL